MPEVDTQSITREEISSLLSSCDSVELVALVDSLINTGVIGQIEMVRPPSTGTVQLQVREPICEERFIVGDALVTTAEVSIDGTLGWAMRTGADSGAAVAAAVADAQIARVGLHNIPELSALVMRTKLELLAAEALEWAEISGTVIDFEELD